MKIQYASDLHLEFEENSDYFINNPLKVMGDILIIIIKNKHNYTILSLKIMFLFKIIFKTKFFFS